MGNDANKYISLHVKDEYIQEVLSEEKRDNFYKLYQQFSQMNGFININDFSKLTKIDEEQKLEQIFDIFASKKGKMYFHDLLVFYTSFTHKKLKSVLLSFLLFGKVGKISKINYCSNISHFLNINNDLLPLNNREFLESIIYVDKGYSSYLNWKYYTNLYTNTKEKEKNSIYFDKNLFINNLNNLILQNKIKFSFFNGYSSSSKLANKPINIVKKNVYICDCLLENMNVNINSSDELEEMRPNFFREKSVTNGHLPLINFENIMKEFRINQKLIDIIVKFLKYYTMKDYIIFEDFQNLMSNLYFRVSVTQKKVFLFKMILAISNEKTSIKASQLAKILKIENKEFKPSGTIDEKKFLSIEDPIINSEIDTYMGYIETFGLLPYLKFGVKPIGQDLLKRIINFILNKKTAEEYLIENFDKCDYFYPINMTFWNSLIEPNIAPEIEMNNSTIAEEDKIYYIKKRSENKEEGKKDNEEQKQTIKKENTNDQNKSQQGNEQKEKNKNDNKDLEPKQKTKKIGKLKKDKKYGTDFVIICGELYQKISKNFEIDYEIKLEKVTKYIPQKKEEKNDGNTVDETPEGKVEEKLEINIERNYLYKKGNEKDGIKEYVVDFYPIKYIPLSLKLLINHIETENKKIAKNKKKEEFEKKSKEEKDKIKKERENREKKYIEKLKQLYDLYNEGAIEKSLFEEKKNILDEQYKDIFPNDDQKDKNEKTKLKKSEFFELMKENLNDIIYLKSGNIQKQSRFTTIEEMREIILKNNKHLEEKVFNISLYSLDKEFIIPKEESRFMDNVINDFTLFILDIKNKDGIFNLSILEQNEKILDKEKEEETTKGVDEIKNVEILSKEELKKIKDNQNERERAKKQQEKLQREKYEMEKEKMEKLKKEQEQEKEKEKEKMITPPYGIPNFGNTCYFNSINQIFLNLPIMQKLFMNPKLKYFINKNNKFGYKGKFINAFLPLYQIYPRKIDDYIQNLKALTGKFKETFNNRDQQDANEYLNFVLEALHEELNLKSSKRYIEDKDENYKYNNEEELGNIAWANNLRRNVSFIDSIFMFQLKSNLTCRKCGTKKLNFETNYVFDLPLSLCKMVTVNVNLYRLPFKYKVYYDKISKNFSDFIKLEENKDKNIKENLWNYYSDKLNYEQKLEHMVNVNFSFDIDRQKTIGDIIQLLRKISILELEPEDYDLNINNKEISEYKINHLTELIAYSNKTKIIKNDAIIDNFVDINDKIRLNIYEVLNTNGFNIINGKNKDLSHELNIFSYKIKTKGIIKLKDYEDKIKNTSFFKYKTDGNTDSNDGETKSISSSSTNEDSFNEENKIKILSLNDKLTYYEEEIFKNNDLSKKNKFKIVTEYIIPIVHFHRDLNPGRANLFLDFYYSSMRDFPKQFLVFNNSNNFQITPKYLYNYIWDYNSLYMNHPNKTTDKFWWNLEPDSKNYSRKCYPFVIRIVKKKVKYAYSYDCAKCPWYNFCFGCVLFPDDDKYLEMHSDYIIFVDWCNSLIKEEIESFNFNVKNFPDEEISQCIDSQAKNDKNKQYQSIQDCFDLFFEKEKLEDPLSCRECGGPQNFIKNYEINKLPYVLILSLKRFKFNENNNFKLRQFIKYPTNNFELKDKKYDLFGVVYHYGSINSGHYVCSLKHNNQWILCDDRRVYEISEDKVVNSNAYILFYISQESINKSTYYNCLSSLMQHLTIDKAKKTYYFDDENYFMGEPVKTPYGEGYVMEDYIEDFNIEENNSENSQNIDEEKTQDKNEKETKENEDKKEISPYNENKAIINNNKNGMIKIKFDFAKGVINKKNVQKQILYDEKNN